MKKFIKTSMLFASTITLMFGTMPAIGFAATTPNLGAAATYGVLSDTYVNTNVANPTTINGDIGFTTAPAALPLGSHANYGFGAPYATAGTDQAAALAALNGQGCDFTFVAPAVDLSATLEHPSTYSPGVYCNTGALSIGTNIILDGAGTYVFRSGGALNAVAGSIVSLAGAPAASACDVFWTPNGATTLNANSTFIGTVIPVSQDITVLDTTLWIGRALTFGHTVTTPNANVIITAPTCALPPVVVPAPVVTATVITPPPPSTSAGRRAVNQAAMVPQAAGEVLGAFIAPVQVAFVPSMPNTGQGGEATLNWAILLGSIILVALGLIEVRKAKKQTIA